MTPEFRRDRADFCNCVVEDFSAEDKGRACVTCTALGVNCLGGSHPRPEHPRMMMHPVADPADRRAAVVSHSGSGSSSSSSSSSSSAAAAAAYIGVESGRDRNGERESVDITKKRLRKPLELDENGKRRLSCSDTKYVTVPDRLNEYPGNMLRDNNGELYCDACARVICMKKSTVKNHVEGSSHCKNMQVIRSTEV